MMMNFPTLLSSKSTDGFDSIEFCHRGKGFIEINAWALFVSTGTEASFIFDARRRWFFTENPFAWNNLGANRKRDKLLGLHGMMASHFVIHSLNLVEVLCSDFESDGIFQVGYIVVQEDGRSSNSGGFPRRRLGRRGIMSPGP
jgi:hypothetical protein